MQDVEFGIMGGTGLYEASALQGQTEESVLTEYGDPSDHFMVGIFHGRKVAFLPRHGVAHKIPPHSINYRANLDAFKQLGVKRIIAPQAVGSLKEEYRPGDLVVPDQFIDRTTGRASTFYDFGQVCHIGVADPFCPELRTSLITAARELGYTVHERGTYVCVQGPRFSTKAESNLYRRWNADIIGMTLVPECVLAREAEICYAPISMVTDYDVWKDSQVTLEEVVRVMKENNEKVKQMLEKVVPAIPQERNCACGKALEGALL